MTIIRSFNAHALIGKKEVPVRVYGSTFYAPEGTGVKPLSRIRYGGSIWEVLSVDRWQPGHATRFEARVTL